MQIKGKIFNIQRFSLNDGPGIRTTIFFKGCPLECAWCHNPECFHDQKNVNSFDAGQIYSAEEVLDVIRKDVIFFDESGGGVTFSGGEPMMQIQFLKQLLSECKTIDVSTAVDTCGYTTFDHFQEIVGLVDIFLYDLKLMNDREHIDYTGVSNKLIHDNLKLLAEIHKNINIRIPLIPGITDTERNLESILDFLTSLKSIRNITLLPYNEFGINKYRKLEKDYKLGNLKTQSDESLSFLSNSFSSRGFEVNIRG